MDVSGHIHEIGKFMDNCLEDWLEYISEQRDQHYHLNHFTTTQLVILRQEIAKMHSGVAEASHLIYPILGHVKSACSPENIHQALRDTQMKLLQSEQELVKVDSECTSLTQQENDSEQEKQMQEFIKTMMENDYSEALARLAVEAVGVEDISKGWLKTFSFLLRA